MTKQEFIKKYCWAPESAADCHQITWDLMEEITEELQDADNAVDLDTYVGALLYKIDILLEVIDKSLPDYNFLLQIKKELEKVEEEMNDPYEHIHMATNEMLAEMIEENVEFRFRRTNFGNRLLYFDEFRPDLSGKMLTLDEFVELLNESAARLHEKHKAPFNREAFDL